MREERVIIISLQKSGTHLIQELMVHLGYGMWGESRITPEIEPKFSSEDKAKLRHFALAEDEQKDYERSSSHLREALDREAWLRTAWSWQIRLQAPVENRYGTHTVHSTESTYKNTELMRMRFSDTPPNICWIYHQLNVKTLDGLFIQEWSQTGRPRIILNIRDPRDVMVSFVNYLSGYTGRGYGNFSEFQAISRVLNSFDNFAEKLTYALEDVNFPGHGDLRDVYWLLKHPQVCTVRFEELIGPRGGGSREAQIDAIQRVLKHLNIEGDPEELAEKVYNPSAFTFHKGKQGSWRECYTPSQLALFEKRFGEVLNLFGYREEDRGGHSRDRRVKQRTTLGSARASGAGIPATQ